MEIQKNTQFFQGKRELRIARTNRKQLLDLNSTITLITLNINHLTTQIKRQIVSDNSESKTQPYAMYRKLSLKMNILKVKE